MQQEHKQTPRTTTATTKLLTAVVLMQGLVLAGQWTGAPASQSAQAQAAPGGGTADPAAYRQQTLDEMKAMNAKLEKVVNLLESGKLQVTVEAKKADVAPRK
jgi:hypothetical protein